MSRRQKGGPAEGPLSQLRDCIARGLEATATDRAQVASQMAEVRAVAATVDVAGDDYDTRRTQFDQLLQKHTAAATDFDQRLAARMTRWQPGLFVGDGTAERRVEPLTGRPFLPEDNYDLERSFRLPKGHARHVHGHAHVGVALVQRGATLVPTLDAHAIHSAPFTHDDLRPYRNAPEPPHQRDARARGALMRRARSEKRRPQLLDDLKRRYLEAA